MNLLFVLDGLWVGGTKRSMAEMLPCLVDLGVHPTVDCLRTRSEALAAALPVVASDTPGVREVVRAGENALLVPPERPAELAAAVGELLGDPGRAATFGEESRRIFEVEHTLERAIAGMVRLYDELIGEGSGDGA